MKILQLHTNAHGLLSENGRPMGGLEKVVLDSHDAFTKNKFQSYFIDSIQSHSLSDLKFDLSQKNYNIFKWDIFHWIENNSPDIIVVHGSNKLFKFLTDMEVPCLFVDHQMHTSINKLYHEELFRYTIPKARLLGSKYITVSHTTAIQAAKKINQQKLCDREFVHDGWLKFQYATEELKNRSIFPSNGGMITIGRSAIDKSPHKIIKLAEKHNLPYRIFTMLSSSNKDKEQEYFDKYLKNNSNISVNQSRTITMAALQEAGMYVSTSPNESAGITAFEALCFGVPVLLFESNFPHASRMFSPDPVNEINQNASREEIEHLLNMNLSKRKICSECVIEFNSMKSFVSLFLDMVKNIPRYERKTLHLGDFEVS